MTNEENNHLVAGLSELQATMTALKTDLDTKFNALALKTDMDKLFKSFNDLDKRLIHIEARGDRPASPYTYPPPSQPMRIVRHSVSNPVRRRVSQYGD